MVRVGNAGPSTDHPSDEDLSLGTPTASGARERTPDFAQDEKMEKLSFKPTARSKKLFLTSGY
jgi:hypothetical protein